MLEFIYWSPDPVIFTVPGITWSLRWYGVCWLLGFVLSQRLTVHIWGIEGKNTREVDPLTMYIFVGALLGARLGHYLFYEPAAFLQKPFEIILPPYSGLASHGGVMGTLLAIFFFCRSRNYHYLWILDRLVIGGALTGAFIRLGNLLNSEILGTPTTVPWAFVFEAVDHLPRHPAQLYEALFCSLLVVFLYVIWKTKRKELYNGYLFGLFLILLFSQRFVVEGFKENQEAFENGLLLNMGQLLSIPFVVTGILVLLWSAKVKSKESVFREVKNLAAS